MSKKDLINIIQCDQEIYTTCYDSFLSYSKKNPKEMPCLENWRVESGLVDYLFLENSIKLLSENECNSEKNYVDMRFEDAVLISPEKERGYKRAKDIITRRRETEEDKGSTIFLLIHPESKDLVNYVAGFEECWKDEKFKHKVFIVYSADK